MKNQSTFLIIFALILSINCISCFKFETECTNGVVVDVEYPVEDNYLTIVKFKDGRRKAFYMSSGHTFKIGSYHKITHTAPSSGGKVEIKNVTILDEPTPHASGTVNEGST